MRISKLHAEKKAAYEAAKPKQFGNLHQRVKYLAKLASEAHEKHAEILRECPLLEELRLVVFDVQCEAALNDCDTKSRAAGKRQAFIVQC